jgi:hypothetical protein
MVVVMIVSPKLGRWEVYDGVNIKKEDGLKKEASHEACG